MYYVCKYNKCSLYLTLKTASKQLIQQNIHHQICSTSMVYMRQSGPMQVGLRKTTTDNMPCNKYFVQQPSLTAISLVTNEPWSKHSTHQKWPSQIGRTAKILSTKIPLACEDELLSNDIACDYDGPNLDFKIQFF